MLHPQPVHLAGELLAELVEESLTQKLLLERPEHARLDVVAPDRPTVRTTSKPRFNAYRISAWNPERKSVAPEIA